MKVLATLINVGIIMWACIMLAKEGIPNGFSDKFMVVGILFIPLLNLYVFHFSKISQSDNLVSLYFKRKYLEEKMKIAAIQQNKKESSLEKTGK